MITLPAPCPLCGCILQRHNADPGSGVAPHYRVVHPGKTPPEVAA
jgi:hypothetical protein